MRPALVCVFFLTVAACGNPPEAVRPDTSSSPTATAPTAAPSLTAITSASSTPPAPKAFVLESERGTHELTFASAELRPGGLVVQLTDAPLKCGDWPRPPMPSLTFYLGAGADGSFSAGKLVTAHVEPAARGFGHVRVEPFDLAEGKHVIGTLSFVDPGSGNHNGPVIEPSKGSGTFDAVICPIEETAKASLKPPGRLSDDGPLAFDYERRKAAPKTVLVMVEFDGNDPQPWVSRIEAFEEAHVTCDSTFSRKGVDMKVYFGLEAADLGSAQPARFEPDGYNARTSRESQIAWVKIEPFDLAKADTVKASVVAYAPPYDTPKGATTPEHLEPASLTGTVEAKICRYGSKFGKPYL